MIQLSPAFVLGTLHDRHQAEAFTAHEIVSGLLAGLAVAMALYAAGLRNVWGFHAGTLGVAVNYFVCWSARRLRISALV